MRFKWKDGGLDSSGRNEDGEKETFWIRFCGDGLY